MRFFVNAVDRFCARHPRFGVPRLMLYIVIGNAIVYVFSVMNSSLLDLLKFNPGLIAQGQVWRLVTFVFIPNYTSISDLLWQALFLYFYYFIGSTLEREWGSGKFTIYYGLGTLLTLIYGLIICAISGFWGTIGINTSYINLAMFFAFATLYPDHRVLLFFIIPVKMKWLAYFNAFFFIISIITESFPQNLLPIIGILNYLLFFAPELIDRIRRIRRPFSKRTINFKSAAREQQKKARERGYRHKCAVCGRTDTENPGLEFRYCSRCAGYHCFCVDHINNHVHFTE